MKVLSIGTDRKLFEEGSAVRQRAIEYAGLFGELHIVVFTKRIRNYELGIMNGGLKIATNCWIYPTNSWSRWFYVWDAIRLGKRIIRDSKFVVCDSVITAQDPFECGLVALKLSKKKKLPLHVQIHTDFLSPYFARFSFLNHIRVLIARKILSKASGIRVVSERIKNSLSNINCQMSKVSVLPIWTDLEKIKNTAPAFDLKQKYPQWSLIILVVARLSPEKNIDFALEVLKGLLQKYPKTGMVILGEGTMGESLKRKARNLKLQDSVAFEGEQKEVTSYYKTANLFLQTSLYEGFGLALLEAVASGCPAVSSDVGIAPKLLSYNENSFACPVNDLACFVNKVAELIENNQLRELFTLDIAPASVAPFILSKEAYLKAYKALLESCLTA